MKKVFNFILILFFMIILFGCNQKKCLVTFRIDFEEQIVEINKRTILDYNLISSYEENEIEGFYYDEEYTLSYDFQEINDDTTIYVKTNRIEVTLVVIYKNIKIKVSQNKPIKMEDISKYAEPYEIEGLYYDCRFTKPYNDEGITEETTIFVDTNITLDTARPVGEILTLQEAYNKNILTMEDLYQIQNNIHDYCDNKDTFANIIDGIYPCEWISEDLIRQIVYDKESQLNPACEGCLEFELIKKYFIYFGTYNDCIVFRAEGCGLYIGTDWGANINIDGSIIHLPEGPNLYVWIPVESSN